MGAENDKTHPDRQPEGKEGAGSHQEGKYSVQAGHTQRRAHAEREQRQPDSANDHQTTISGKREHGPEDKVGRDAGANDGSKSRHMESGRPSGTGREPGDIGDNRRRTRAAQ